ncbi:unnamed protein product, partial [Anisakis simplex]|uniref:Ribosomal protein S12 n=1 Tax=Anisakis simplex TaxID=6269 RepID=A0A0M3JCU1_ANISI
MTLISLARVEIITMDRIANSSNSRRLIKRIYNSKQFIKKSKYPSKSMGKGRNPSRSNRIKTVGSHCWIVF